MLREEGVPLMEGMDGMGESDARPVSGGRRPVRKTEFRTSLKPDECIKRLKASVCGEGEMLGEVHRKRFAIWKRNSIAYSPVFHGRVTEEGGETVIRGGYKSSVWKKFFLPLLFVAVVASLIAANLNHVNTGVPTILLALFSLAVPVYFLLGLREEREIVNYLRGQLDAGVPARSC